MKNPSIFLLGLGVGLPIGFGAAYLYLKSKHEAKLEEEISSLKEYYKDKEEFDKIQYNRRIREAEGAVPKSYEEALDAVNRNKERIERVVTGIIDKEGYLKYHELNKRLDVEDVDVVKVDTTVTSSDEWIELDELEDQNDTLETVARPEWSETFEILDEEDFSLDYYEYDKVQLIYYAQEDILVTEDEEILDDGVKVIGETGMTALASYEVEIDDGDSIYIRNNVRETDYAVLYQELSYFTEEEDL